MSVSCHWRPETTSFRAIITATTKWTNARNIDRGSIKLDWKLLLHVESRAGAQQLRHRASTRIAIYPQLVKTTLWSSETTKTLHGAPCRSDANYSNYLLHQNRFKVCWAWGVLLPSFYVRRDTCMHTTFWSQMENFWMLTLNSSRPIFFLWPICLFIVADMVFSFGWCGSGVWSLWRMVCGRYGTDPLNIFQFYAVISRTSVRSRSRQK